MWVQSREQQKVTRTDLTLISHISPCYTLISLTPKLSEIFRFLTFSYLIFVFDIVKEIQIVIIPIYTYILHKYITLMKTNSIINKSLVVVEHIIISRVYVHCSYSFRYSRLSQ